MDDKLQNPYVGLRPFETEESLLFFGRNEQTSELLLRLHKHHFVAVVGSSGSGKSSLLKAGLIPALNAGYLVEDSDKWMIASMKPGQNPLVNLVTAIMQKVNPQISDEAIAAFIQKLKDTGVDAFIDLLKPLWQKQNLNFFLLVDQFEEFFRFADERETNDEKDDAIDFINILLDLAAQRHIPIYVVLTMRSDFIGECAHYHGLPEAMNESQFLVPKISRRQLKLAIEGPAKLFGKKIENALLSHLLNAAGRLRDELPLLQHVLMRLWDYEMGKRKFDTLTLENYYKIGGLEKALSTHAEEAMVGMNEDEIAITRKMFQALTTTDASARKLRRPKLLSALVSITNANRDSIIKIIQRFNADKRNFLVLTKIAHSDDLMVDISHESLMRVWERLSDWVDEETESAKIYNRICENALLFNQNQASLWRDPDLELALNWQSKNQPNLTWANQYNEDFDIAIDFIKQSLAEKKRDTAEKNKRKKITRIITIAIIVVVSGLALWALVERNQSSKSAQEALLNEKRAIAGENKAKSESFKAGLLLEKIKSKNDSLTLAWLETRKASGMALTAAQLAQLASLRAQKSEKNEQNANRKNFALNLANKSTLIKPGAYAKHIKPLMALQAYKFFHLSGGEENNPEILKSLFNGYRSMQNESEYLTYRNDVIYSIDYSPDGNSIAIADAGGNLSTVSSKNLSQTLVSFGKQSEGLQRVAYNGSGSKIAASTDGNKYFVFTISKSDKKPDKKSLGKDDKIIDLKWYGNQIVIACANNLVYLADENNKLKSIKTPSAPTSISVCQATGLLAIGTKNGQILIVDLAKFQDAMVLTQTPNEAISSISFNQSGTQIAVGTMLGNIYVYNTISAQNYTTAIVAHRAEVTQLTFNNNLLASTSLDKTVKVWNLSSDAQVPLVNVQEHTNWVYGLRFSPDGHSVASCGKDKSVRTYIISEDQLVNLLTTHVSPTYLTEDEWKLHIGSEFPYEKTIP